MKNHCVCIVKCIRNVCKPHFKIFKISKNIFKKLQKRCYHVAQNIMYFASTTNELTKMKSIDI